MNTREATESKMTAGVTGKSKETVGSEAEMVSGTESGADTEVGMDSKSTADRSRVGAEAEASARCAITTGGGDAGANLRLTVASTMTRDNVAEVMQERTCNRQWRVP